MNVHCLLAARDLAFLVLKLHYFSTNDNMYYGKQFMIVIDYINFKPLLGCFTKQQS